MKKLSLLSMLMIAFSSFSQSEVLNQNQVRAQINANGILFTESAASQASYEVPKTSDGSGADLIFTSSFSYAGLDLGGGIHMAASKFMADSSDLFTGPIANDYTNQNYIDRYDHVYTVTATQIHDHQINWNHPNYVMPHDLEFWPGNGDTNNGEASILAPFVDYNGNNLYEPHLGDHPYIRGDKTTYFILNDLAAPHAHTQSDPLGMEFHYMIYQYATNDFLDSITFINIKVINRSQNNYNQFIVSNYTDFDIGGSQDDYIGCSSSKKMIFGYNGDNNDDAPSIGEPLFGANPPTCGIQLLNHQIGSATYYANPLGAQGDPVTVNDFWNYMNGNWSDGTSFTVGGSGYGGTTPTNFVLDGNPNDANAWTEASEGFVPGDRRAFMAAEPVSNFASGDYICYDFAVLYSRTGGNNVLNVNGLFDVADSVQAFYDAQPYFYCEPSLLSNEVLNTKNNDINIYPNPTHSKFMISAPDAFNMEVYDISGKIILKADGVLPNQSIETPEQSGIYLVKIILNDYSISQKLIVK